MKKEHPIRTLLGITQEDIAMLLGISRGQWSMFEIGKRDLPLSANQLLAEMLVYIQTSEPTGKQAYPEKQLTITQHFERLLRENEFQQMRTARKVAAAIKKQDAQARLLRLTDFLVGRETGIGSTIGMESLNIKMSRVPEIPMSTFIAEQQHKQELLELEKLLLESKLEKLRLGVDIREVRL